MAVHSSLWVNHRIRRGPRSLSAGSMLLYRARLFMAERKRTAALHELQQAEQEYGEIYEDLISYGTVNSSLSLQNAQRALSRSQTQFAQADLDYARAVAG